jgi:hypothetical protein
MKTNKSQLQPEFLKKVKPGIKPSNLKKKTSGEDISRDTHGLNSPDNSVLKQGLPTPPTLKPKQDIFLVPELTATPVSHQSPLQNQAQSPTKTEPTSQPQPKIKPILCATCSTFTKTPRLIKVATNDPQYNLIKGQAYPFCSPCSPKIKEFNEYDLITDDLWQKYPYSSASEILELEFGIKRKEEKPW